MAGSCADRSLDIESGREGLADLDVRALAVHGLRSARGMWGMGSRREMGCVESKLATFTGFLGVSPAEGLCLTL